MPLALPFASALSRRDRLWPAALGSAVVHAVVLVWALARAAPPAIDLEQKAIVAKLVRLGEKRPEQFLPRKEAAPAPAPPSNGKAGGTSLASILSKVQKQADAERWGDRSGSAAGDSNAAEGDQYLALVDRALRANYVVPVTIPERERLYLEANIVLWLEPDGRIARWRQERPSGNPAFDAAVERTLRATPRVPPPPSQLRDSYRTTGIKLVFQ